MRKCIRKPHLKLAQIYKRISEKDNFVSTSMQMNIKICLSDKHAEGLLPEHIPADLGQQFKKVKIGQFTFATTLRDSCCFLKNSRMCIIKNIIQTGGQVWLTVKQFTSTTAIYDVGITSDSLDVFHCRNSEETLEEVSLTDVKSKAYMIPKWSKVEEEKSLLFRTSIFVCRYYHPCNCQTMKRYKLKQLFRHNWK